MEGEGRRERERMQGKRRRDYGKVRMERAREGK